MSPYSSMPSAIRVNGSYVRVLIDWLDRYQLSAPSLRAAVQRYGPGDPVPLAQWRELLQRAEAVHPGDGRGLEIGACISTERVGVLGYLVAASDNVGQALHAYQRFEALFYGIQMARISIRGSTAELGWPLAGRNSPGLLTDETAISALVSYMRQLAPSAPGPVEVAFSSPAPAQPQVYEAFFGCRVIFAAPYVRVRFPAAYLDIPLQTANPSLRALLDRQSLALSSALPGGQFFALQVQQVILRLLPAARAALADVADEMAMSTRTLQRRLREEGQSFQGLLDRTRQELAQTYLTDVSLSLVEITMLLGFAEQSSFNRAFRQWFDLSPAKWRRNQRATMPPSTASA
ncbi:AraC family transcriptional regulator [Alcanivorax sp. 1008]|uniref:AraC family transcriptional regulator n=1 Tax=Alcanivorax sp. 1008 TaxID=2816853 RepID=UPI001D54E2A8|nr:AraC family transcriptional regulator [Alcanivorax sp. 1008]MCC1495870.1 AraC family transcriptional regulator ligand-binding domain-containing protein [Alcanivorax sp. 1008]